MIKVSRSLRELSYKSLQAREKMTRILGREPTLKELSEELQIDCEEIVQAMESSVEVESIYKPIHQKEGSEILLMDKLEEKDRQEEKVLDRIVLKEVLETLEAKERTIIYLRYFAGKTQAEIGKKMGMSQVQVSRTEKKVLERMRKGHSAAAIVAAGQKARRCGMALSVTAISGLGSVELWREHAIGTAEALSAMKPEYIGLLTLMVERGTPLEQWVRDGEFTLLSPVEVLKETELFLQHIDSEGSVFRMNHASNYLTLKGTLNRDRQALLDKVQSGLSGVGLKPEFLRAL